MLRSDLRFSISNDIENTICKFVNNYKQNGFQGRTLCHAVSDKMLYSLFNKKDFISIYNKYQEDGVYNVFQEVILRLSKNYNITVPSLFKEKNNENNGSCYIYTNRINLNLNNFINAINDDNLEYYSLDALKTIAHEIYHQKQKNDCVLFLDGKKDLKEFSNIEKTEFLCFLSRNLFLNTLKTLDGIETDTYSQESKEFEENIKISKKKIDDFYYYDPCELGACIKGYEFIKDLQSNDLITKNQEMYSFIANLTSEYRNYNYEKFQQIDINIIKNQIKEIFDFYTTNKIHSSTIDKLFNVYENINWEEYEKYIRNQAKKIENSYFFSALNEM